MEGADGRHDESGGLNGNDRLSYGTSSGRVTTHKGRAAIMSGCIHFWMQDIVLVSRRIVETLWWIRQIYYIRVAVANECEIWKFGMECFCKIYFEHQLALQATQTMYFQHNTTQLNILFHIRIIRHNPSKTISIIPQNCIPCPNNLP